MYVEKRLSLNFMSNNNNNAHTLRHICICEYKALLPSLYVYDGANKKTSTQYFWRVEAAAEAQRQRRRNNTKQIIVYMCVV